jgi:hypothetical protein
MGTIEFSVHSRSTAEGSISSTGVAPDADVGDHHLQGTGVQSLEDAIRLAATR